MFGQILLINIYLIHGMGARGRVVGWGTILQAGRLPVRVPDEVDFFNLPNFQPQYAPDVDSASNKSRNEYQEFFWL
jgi:hypothetical protein